MGLDAQSSRRALRPSSRAGGGPKQSMADLILCKESDWDSLQLWKSTGGASESTNELRLWTTSFTRPILQRSESSLRPDLHRLGLLRGSCGSSGSGMRSRLGRTSMAGEQPSSTCRHAELDRAKKEREEPSTRPDQKTRNLCKDQRRHAQARATLLRVNRPRPTWHGGDALPGACAPPSSASSSCCACRPCSRRTAG